MPNKMAMFTVLTILWSVHLRSSTFRRPSPLIPC